MMRRTAILALIALVAAPMATQASWAQQFPRDSFAPQNDRAQDSGEVELGQILRGLRREYGGQHLDARKNGSRYVITWIAEDGRRLVIEVDARSGRTISVRG